jgi:hypothetical protein
MRRKLAQAGASWRQDYMEVSEAATNLSRHGVLAFAQSSSHVLGGSASGG